MPLAGPPASTGLVWDRPWVFDALDTLLANDEGDGVVLLTGPPGAGKTTLVKQIEATLTADPGDEGAAPRERALLRPGVTAAIHYCAARDDRSLDPLRWVRAVAALLAERVPGFVEALVAGAEPGVSVTGTAQVATAHAGATVGGVVLKHLDLGGLGPRMAFDRRVVAPLEQVGTGEPVLLVVDGLDETLAYQEFQGLVDVLAAAARSLRSLPRPVRLLATSRPDQRVLSRLPHRRLDLVADAPPGPRDVELYVAARFAAEPDARRADGTTTARIAAAAGGSFLYARLVADELLADPERLASGPASLPDTLAAVYRQDVEREAADPRWAAGYRPVLGLLAVARGDGLTDRTLAGAAGFPVSTTLDVLAGMSRYLSGTWPHGPFRLHHESFRQFLVQESPFPVYPDEASRALADHLVATGDGRWLDVAADDDPTGRYALHHVVAHLGEAADGSASRPDRERCLARAQQLLGDVRFLEARTRAGDVDGVLHDFERMRGRREPEGSLRGLHRIMDREAHVLRAWEPGLLPKLFAQLVHLRAGDLADTATATETAERLGELGGAGWRFRWARGPGRAGLLRSLSMRGAVPKAVVVTPDGRVCVAGDDRGGVRAWDLGTGRERWHVQAHHAAVAALAAGLEWAVSCAENGTVTSLAIADGGLRPLDTRGPVAGVTATADGARVIGVGRQGVTSWNLTDGKPIRLLEDGMPFRPRLLGTRDGTTLLYRGADNVELFDFAARQEFSYHGWDHQRRLWVAAPMPDGRSLLCFFAALRHPERVTSPDLAPEVRDVATGELLARLDGPTFAWRAVVEPGGTWAVSAGKAGLVVWDLREHRAVGILPGVEAAIEGLAASAAEPVLVTADGDRTVRVWDVREGAPPDAPPAREVRSLGERAGRCVAGFRPGPPAAWALADGADLPVTDADRHARRTTIVSGRKSAPSRDGRRRARASWHVPMLGMFTGSEVTGRDEYLPAVIEVLADGEIVATLEDPCAPLTALALSADGGRVLAASWDGTVAVYHVADGVFVRRLPVGTALAGAAPVTGGRTLGAWLDTLVATNAAVSAVAATWDDRLVVATRNGSLQEWDLATGLQLAATVLEAPASLLALDDTDEALLLADERGRVTCLTRHPG